MVVLLFLWVCNIVIKKYIVLELYRKYCEIASDEVGHATHDAKKRILVDRPHFLRFFITPKSPKSKSTVF